MSEAAIMEDYRGDNVIRPRAFERDGSSADRPGLAGGDGGGSGTMLEVRVAKIEAEIEYIKRDLNEVRADLRKVVDRLAEMQVSLAGLIEQSKKQLKHTATKFFVVAGIPSLLGVMTGLIGYAPRLQTLLGTAPPAATSAGAAPTLAR